MKVAVRRLSIPHFFHAFSKRGGHSRFLVYEFAFHYLGWENEGFSMGKTDGMKGLSMAIAKT
jgi:hypothetical protein